jgi:hypothetical protein
VHENDVNKCKKQIATRLHAAEDMIEAEVAASWLPEVDHPWRKRVVVTGMVIAYARVFVGGDHTLDREEYKPTDPRLADAHESLLRWRAKVYAHTDKESGRSAKVWPGSGGAGRAISWQRSDFPVDRLAEAIKLFQAQRARFESEAEELQRALDAELAGPSA